MDSALYYVKSDVSPSLTTMTKKAINLLKTNRKGFILMVESGQIDWASHSNDPGYLLHQILRNQSIAKSFD